MSNFCLLSPLADLPHHSRSHQLRTFSSDEASVYIKREDELGPLSMGIKTRKYLSLIPFLKSLDKTVVITGSAFSNNVLGLSLLCKQQRIPHILVLDRSKHSNLIGNSFFLYLANDEKQIIWIDKDYTIEQAMTDYKDQYWLPLGSSCKEALLGSMTIASDIIENEKELGITFDHIFTDSGTGLSASALHLGLSMLNSSSHIHVVQVAGNKEDFLSMHKMLKDYVNNDISLSPLSLYMPAICPSFGSISKSLIEFIKSVARHEGILLDPMYNAKLFFTAKEKIKSMNLQGNILIIHSGGTLALSGFSHLF